MVFLTPSLSSRQGTTTPRFPLSLQKRLRLCEPRSREGPRREGPSLLVTCPGNSAQEGCLGITQ